MKKINKWTIFAVAHFAVLLCLTFGVGLIALRLGRPPENARDADRWASAAFPVDTEISRLNLLSARIDIIQNNIANTETIGFKRRRSFVEEGVEPKISGNQLDMTQGPLESTGGATDLAIQGDGFFRVKVRPGLSDGTAYTRNGLLMRNREGELVVGIGEGYSLIPPLHLPPNATNISVSQDGTVTCTPAGGSTVAIAGQISLCLFTNAPGLERSDGLYVESAASGPPIISRPGDNAAGILLQGYLESSNVDPVKEEAALRRLESMIPGNNQPYARADRRQAAKAASPM